MGIVFFCQSCGARFEVDPRMAGKKGHCKKCGQVMSIPRAEQIASMAAMPALAAAAVGGGVAAGAAAGPEPASLGSLLKEGISQAALAPLTVERMPVARRLFAKRSPLDDDLGDSKPYALVEPVRERSSRVRSQDRVLKRFWRRELGVVQKIFRKINQAAYLISLPFVMILLAGIVLKNPSVALFGATAVVLLNIGRLAAGVANLAVIPLRDGIDFKKMKKPIHRVIEPVVTIALVVLAFTFVPWLSRGKAASGTFTDRVRAGAHGLRRDMEGQLGELRGQAKSIGVDKAGSQALDKLNELADKAKNLDTGAISAQVQEKLKQITSPSSSGPPAQEGSRRGLRKAIDALEKRTQEELDKAKTLSQPRQQP